LGYEDAKEGLRERNVGLGENKGMIGFWADES